MWEGIDAEERSPAGELLMTFLRSAAELGAAEQQPDATALTLLPPVAAVVLAASDGADGRVAEANRASAVRALWLWADRRPLALAPAICGIDGMLARLVALVDAAARGDATLELRVDGGEVAGLVTIAACYVESAAQ